MSTEPPGPPDPNAPSEPPSTPPTPQEEHGWAPAAPPPAPPEPAAYAPPPAGPPPAYAPPPSVAGPRRGRGGLLAIILVIVVLIVGGGGYAAAGFATANSKLNSSTDAYNKVTDHLNKLTDFFNNLSSQFDKNNLTSSSVDSVKQEKTLLGQLVSQSQSSQPTVTADDQSLANADASLSENSWLTVFSKSSLDKQSTKIEDLRAGLKIAQTILADYIKYGTFYETLDDAVIDIDAMSTALDNHDINGANTAVQTLKSDLTKAQTENVAGAGISTQMSGFVTTMQSFATDFGNLLSAAQAGNSAGVNAAASALDADSAKLDKFDETAIATEEQNFYKQLIDSYNAAVDKANKA